MILMAITSKGSIVDVERVREGKSVVSTEIIHWFSEDVVRVVFEGVHSRDLSFIGCREIVGEEGGGGKGTNKDIKESIKECSFLSQLR